MTDHVTTQTAVVATLPDGTQIAVDQLPTGELVQIVKLYDGAADSVNAASISAAGALKVDGSAVTQPVSIAAMPSTPVTGPLTDAQLRASRVPVDPSGVTSPISAAALPLPAGASTEATLALIKAKTDNLDVLLSTRTKPADTQKVDGSAVTQPISAAALPLPAGAATDATLTGGTQKAIARGGAKGATAAADITSNPIDANTQALHVDGSKVTQPVSGSVTANVGTTGGLALDATLTGGTAKSIVRAAAKGTTVAADVTSNPVDANTQALHVDGSKVTQPVSGSVTANIGTAGSLALDATLTGGTAKTIARGGQKGTTNTNADITHTASGANHEGLDVILYDAAGNVINPTQIRALTNADVVKAQLQDNAGTAITVGQKAAASSVPVVLANDANGATQASALFTQNRALITYTAVFRLAARPYALSKAMGAASRTQFATIHHAATATKKVKLKRVEVALESNSVAAILMFDLVRITTAPATGNPAITPAPTDPGDAAAETTCLALPTTAGTEGALHSTQEYNLGITGAASTVAPPPGLNWYTLWPQTQGASEASESKFPTIRAGTLEGFAVVCDSNAASTVKGYVVIEFTEE